MPLSTKTDLLEQKITVLQNELALQRKLVAQLQYQVQHGRLPPVANYLKEDHLLEIQAQHYAQLRLIDLELQLEECQQLAST